MRAPRLTSRKPFSICGNVLQVLDENPEREIITKDLEGPTYRVALHFSSMLSVVMEWNKTGL